MSRKKYSEQFKIQVVKQILEEGKTISNISMDLEISRNMIYRWIKEYELHGEEAFVGHGNNRKNVDFEMKKLKDKDKVKVLEIVYSMSKPGNPYDNDMVESFNKSLKTEIFDENKIFIDRNEAKKAIFDYIELFYNRKRRHSSIGYISPLEFEKLNLSK